MVRKRATQDNPLVKITAGNDARRERDAQATAAALARPDSPAERAAREQRLTALCEKHGVPVDMERPLRDQLLLKAMSRERLMWSGAIVPGVANTRPEVISGHASDCVCELCYRKRVKTDVKFSSGKR